MFALTHSGQEGNEQEYLTLPSKDPDAPFSAPYTVCIKKNAPPSLLNISATKNRIFKSFFFSWKLRSIRKFWIQNHFCAILGSRDIYKTKCSSETGQFKSTLCHSGLKTTKFAPSSADWPKTGPSSFQVASSGPINPNWLNGWYNCFYFDHFQNMLEL